MSAAADAGAGRAWPAVLRLGRRRSLGGAARSTLHRVCLNTAPVHEPGLGGLRRSLHGRPSLSMLSLPGLGRPSELSTRSLPPPTEAGQSRAHFPTNVVHTSKYTLVSFLPKNLYEQFRRVANWFFLAVVVLQFFPQFYTIEPIVAALPFIIVLAGTALKDGFEDYKRHTADNNTNNQKTLVLGHWFNVNRHLTVRAEHWSDKPNAYLTLVLGALWKAVVWVLVGIWKLALRAWAGVRGRAAGSGLGPGSDHGSDSSSDSGGAVSEPPSPVRVRVDPPSASQSKLNVATAEPADPQSPPRPDNPDSQVPTPVRGGSISLSTPDMRAQRKWEAHQRRRRSHATVEDPERTHHRHHHNRKHSPLHYLSHVPESGPRWSETIWQDVIVGDVVLLRNNESIPADIVLLSSSEPDCVCYVETKNLDGETNLKIRRGLLETSWVRSPFDCAEIVMTVDCEKPHNNLYTFSGVAHIPHQPSIPVSASGTLGPLGSQPLHASGSMDAADLGASGLSSAPALLATGRTFGSSRSGDGSVSPIESLNQLTEPASLRSPLPGLAPFTPLSEMFSDNVLRGTGAGKTEGTLGEARRASEHELTESPVRAHFAPSVKSTDGASEPLRRISTTPSGGAASSNSGDPSLRLPLTINNLLLRGCVVRNTEWAIGLVVYTGRDTKVILNSGATPSKTSKLDRQANPQILVNLVLLFILCVVCAIGGPIWSAQYSSATNPFVWEAATSGAYTGLIAFFNAVIVLQNIVPISFYITIELVKLVQAIFIHLDVDMYYEPIDRRCVARTYNLSDDLGRIEYVFSDKTGTLTRNVMEFKKCSVGGRAYISDLDPNGPMPGGAPVVVESSFDVFGAGSGHGRGYSFGGGQRWSMGDSAAFDSTGALPVSPMSALPGSGHQKQLSRDWSVQNDGPSAGPSGGAAAPAAPPYENPHIRGLDRVPFVSQALMSHAMGADEPARFIREFFRILAVCHSVLVSARRPAGDESPDLGASAASGASAVSAASAASENSAAPLVYKAQSPDEAALVDAARAVGFTFLKRDSTSVTIDVLGNDERYELLNMIEFNSTRKRMSVIVRSPSGEILLYCKGADSVILERLAPGQQVMADVTNRHLDEFAREGLRTLCLAYQRLDEAVYAAWNVAYTEASTALTDREAKMDACAEQIERELVLVGATAIEDQLQEGVPEAIQVLARAGSQLWVLTGDKLETAVNIGYSCNLLTENMNLICIKEDEEHRPESALQQMQAAMDTFWPGSVPEELPRGVFRASLDWVSQRIRSFGQRGSAGGGVESVELAARGARNSTGALQQEPRPQAPLVVATGADTLAPSPSAAAAASSARLSVIPETPRSSQFDLEFPPKRQKRERKPRAGAPDQQPHALVIDGGCLKHALDAQGSELLLRLARHCRAVLCCRVSPLQKAKVVELVKQRRQAMCLAIGDGANDVSMIQAAHVGVGIAGEEGLQAVMASDYAFAQFRFLAKLLMVQGRWAFKRNSRLILNFFFKNLIWTLPLFYFQFYCGFTLSYVMDYTFLLLYQTVFSSTAVLCMGWFDRELDQYYIFGVPGTYAEGIVGSAFSMRLFTCYMLDAVYQSMCVYWVAFAMYGAVTPFSNGRDADFVHLGTIMAIAGICNANFAIALDMNQWTIPQVVLTFVPCLLAFLWLIIYTSGPFMSSAADMRGVYLELLASGSFWLGLILISTLCMLPRVWFKYGMRLLRPTDTDIVQEVQKYKIPIRGDVYGNNQLAPQRRPSLASARSEMTMTVMKTGETRVNRGFAFSQDAGTRDLLMGGRKHRAPNARQPKKSRLWTPDMSRIKLGVSMSMSMVRRVSASSGAAGDSAPLGSSNPPQAAARSTSSEHALGLARLLHVHRHPRGSDAGPAVESPPAPTSPISSGRSTSSSSPSAASSSSVSPSSGGSPPRLDVAESSDRPDGSGGPGGPGGDEKAHPE